MFPPISTDGAREQNFPQRGKNFLCALEIYPRFSFQCNKLNIKKLNINEADCGQLDTIKLSIHTSCAQLKVMSALSCQTPRYNNTCVFFFLYFQFFGHE